jgi:predicted TIM-barrel fold metal-dependent hydrolase
LTADTPEQLLEKARYLVDNGIRAIWLPSGVLPGGRSPAHPDLDPFWSLAAENNVAICLHVGVDSNIFGTDAWRDAPAFQGFISMGEFRLDPWSMSNMHTRAQNFIVTTVLGGVFERHPMLRFGAMEMGAFWIGPMCNFMDLWYNRNPGRAKTEGLPRLANPPSFYVKRNIRVSPFDFEPIDEYIRNYGLEDVLGFASDYPHIEGGFDPIGCFYNLLKPLGDEVVKKFFVTNGKWLLPD